MNLQQMKYVIYTAKYNSFSKAAKELFVTQPNISNAIKELEQELKIQIFERSKSGVSLTKEGVVFLNQISPVVEQMGLIEDFYAKENEADNMLSVASQHCTLFSETMAQLLLDHTFGDSYKIHILEAKTKEVLEYVQSGMCEIGILLKNRDNRVLSWELEQRNLEFRLLQERHPHVYLRREHPLANKEIITKEDLVPYPYIKYYQGKNSMQFFSEEVVEDHESDKTIYVTDSMTVAQLANRMDAYTMGSGYRRTGSDKGVLKAVPYDSSEVVELGLVISRGRNLSALCNKYLEIVEQYIAQYEC